MFSTSGLGNDSEVNVISNGSYTVTATDAYGCFASATTIVNIDATQTLSAYTIISNKEVHFDESILHGGGIGVTASNKKAKIKKSSLLMDSFKQIKSISTTTARLQVQQFRM